MPGLAAAAALFVSLPLADVLTADGMPVFPEGDNGPSLRQLPELARCRRGDDDGTSDARPGESPEMVTPGLNTEMGAVEARLRYRDLLGGAGEPRPVSSAALAAASCVASLLVFAADVVARTPTALSKGGGAALLLPPRPRVYDTGDSVG